MDEPATPTYLEPSAPTSDRVTDLLERMTVPEKAGQVTGTWGGTFHEPVDVDDLERLVVEYGFGSVTPFGWGSGLTRDPDESRSIVRRLQRAAAEQTRLGIPLLVTADAIHGHAYLTGATVFPNALGMAATWNPDRIEQAAAVTAREVRSTGVHQNYAPTADVGRELRWGRLFETFGESPYLVGECAAAAVDGYRGNGPGDPEGVLATVKHFPAYSQPVRGEDASPVAVSPYQFRNTFLEPFERALEAGVDAVMPSYSSVEGEPCHGSRSMLTDLLRNELGFDGTVVSDWGGIRHLHEDHRVTADHAESVEQARTAGIDVASVGHVGHVDRLVDLVESGTVPEAVLDESVARILRQKFELGLFEDPLVGLESGALGGSEHRSVARGAVEESLTLLSNDDLLPLADDTDLFVGGPNADDLVSLLGGWSVDEDDGLPGKTIREACRDRTEGSITFVQGATHTDALDLERATEAAADADVAVLALGEGWYVHEFGPESQAGVETGEWPTRSALRLPVAQRELVHRVADTGTPVVAVLVTGRPPIVTDLEAAVDALVLAYFPGTEGGPVIAETLFGDVNPSGRLPVSIPRSIGDLPQHHDALAHPTPIGTDEHPPSYDPLYPLGHGLSYTEFAYDDVDVADGPGTSPHADDPAATVTLTVENVGDRSGTETVQVYASQRVGSRVRPTRQLVGFDRVALEPGARTTVAVDVHTETLSYVIPDRGRVLEAGPYRFDVGEHSSTIDLSADD